MQSYSDFVDRILLHSDLLEKLAPTQSYDPELVVRIRSASDDDLTGGKKPGDAATFRLIRGALFYAVDALDEGHRIFQEVSSDLGSYWHGMMHRREADFDNARYWFRRSGKLPFFDSLHRRVSEFSVDMAKQLSWDPYLFTGMCEQARFGDNESLGELRKLQRGEFDVAFDYTWRQSKLG